MSDLSRTQARIAEHAPQVAECYQLASAAKRSHQEAAEYATVAERWRQDVLRHRCPDGIGLDEPNAWDQAAQAALRDRDEYLQQLREVLAELRTEPEATL